MNKDSFLKEIDSLISSIFSSTLSDSGEKIYEGPRSVQEYTQSTGKRFRITKDQKERGLSREEAFKESMISSYGFVDF
tara:strand:- start:114 stop:347 length:234 start_codon:yes stop_codon:yes gene_type:complete